MVPKTTGMDESRICADPEAVLRYHASEPAGKIAVHPTKPCATREELSLAYTPGVAVPCLRIQQNPEASWEYTSRGNLVAVITNGTAVLGLGDIGAAAGKPVMEGKAVLFKRFGGIDAIDLEVDTKDPEKFIQAVRLLEPTFGGMNLEDIKAPECFEIETRLQEMMNIPVFHDDQHGTAVVVGAALLNALHLTNKSIEALKVVFCGAGAAGLACAQLLFDLGVRRENLVLTDRHGVVYVGREVEMDRYKARFATTRPERTLAEALRGADVFVGVSAANVLSGPMIEAMAAQPVLFALANPVPEIDPETARRARPDVILATGRSDLPNQINNLLGFPFIFRGALDVRASRITPGMKMAAVHALAELARSPEQAVAGQPPFGPQALLPSPLDPRLLWHIPPAVAQAAMHDGVAGRPLSNVSDYVAHLKKLSKTLSTSSS